MIVTAIAARTGNLANRFSTALMALVLIQLAAGLVNLLLHAPIWLQIVHLLLSDLLWIALVLLGYTVLARPAQERFGSIPRSLGSEQTQLSN